MYPTIQSKTAGSDFRFFCLAIYFSMIAWFLISLSLYLFTDSLLFNWLRQLIFCRLVMLVRMLNQYCINYSRYISPFVFWTYINCCCCFLALELHCLCTWCLFVKVQQVVSPVLILLNLCLIVPLLLIIRYVYFLDGARRLPTIITVIQNKCLYESKEIISHRNQRWNSSKNLLDRNKIFGNYGFCC